MYVSLYKSRKMIKAKLDYNQLPPYKLVLKNNVKRGFQISVKTNKPTFVSNEAHPNTLHEVSQGQLAILGRLGRLLYT